jgi:hypothetical protein
VIILIEDTNEKRDSNLNKKSRAEYFRRWRKKNPEKDLMIQKRYIEKKLLMLKENSNEKQ